MFHVIIMNIIYISRSLIFLFLSYLQDQNLVSMGILGCKFNVQVLYLKCELFPAYIFAFSQVVFPAVANRLMKFKFDSNIFNYLHLF